KIIPHKEFALVDGKPIAAPSEKSTSSETLKIKLQANPLLKDARENIEIAVGFDARGSFLKTKDGLPLRTISETPNLIRALVAAHGSDALDLFQDDGAVVEQFRVNGVEEMMSFDCGGFELK